MVESWWLTRSLEQNHPYDLNFPWAIRDKSVKIAFLKLIDKIQNSQTSENSKILTYFLEWLIILKIASTVEIKKIENADQLTIPKVMNLLDKHFELSHMVWSARLPVLSFYAIYQILISELERYNDKTLKPLGSHTSADLRSWDIWDIQVNDNKWMPYEWVEVKYWKKIDYNIVEHSVSKILKTETKRYYILSTEWIEDNDKEKVQNLIDEVKETHWCQIIINWLLQTIKYYLRLISDVSEFLNLYIKLVEKDPVIKIEHKEILSDLMNELK